MEVVFKAKHISHPVTAKPCHPSLRKGLLVRILPFRATGEGLCLHHPSPSAPPTPLPEGEALVCVASLPSGKGFGLQFSRFVLPGEVFGAKFQSKTAGLFYHFAIMAKALVI